MSTTPKPFVANELDSSQRTSARLYVNPSVNDKSIRVSTEVGFQWSGMTLGPQDVLRLILWLTEWVTHIEPQPVAKDRNA